MPKQKQKRLFIIVGSFLLLCLLGSLLLGERPGKESIQEVMRDAVLHESGKVSLFGLLEVNPGLVSAYVVTGVLLLLAAILRIFVIPRFRTVPGKLQLLLETWVSFFSDMAKSNSPHHHGFLGAYLFGAGSYIFFGTVFELFGLQAVTTAGHSIALPAPLADINGAIALGCLSYLVILLAGIAVNRFHGAVSGLKEFSLPISMSFRLFGALLSGLLVTELVYYSIYLSFILPVAVGVLFTLLHAVIQTYVLTTLTGIFFGEVTEPHEKKAKKKKVK